MANTFRSQRLVYRAVEENDDDKAFLHSLVTDSENFANFDPQLLKPFSKKDSEKYFANFPEKLLAVLICLPITPSKTLEEEPSSEGTKVLRPIGFIGLQKIESYNLHHRHSNLFLFIGKTEQRKGYGGEAIEWILKWAFEMRGLHRVSIGYMAWNLDAGRLYERLGFVEEGRERECFFFEGGWWDKVVLGMLEGEWRAREAGKREKKKVGGEGGV